MQEQLSVEVCDVQIQVSPPEIIKSEQSTQTDKERVLSVEEKRNALARDLHVNLDAVEEYVRDKEEKARLKAAGALFSALMFTKLNQQCLSRTGYSTSAIPDYLALASP